MTDCDHVWLEGEDWVFDGEDERHIIVYECERCFARLTPKTVNKQLDALRAERNELWASVQQIRDILRQEVGNRTIAELSEIIARGGYWPASRCVVIAEQAIANVQLKTNGEE